MEEARRSTVKSHEWWWTLEPRHTPCAQCSDGQTEQIPLDLIWGMIVYGGK